VPGDWAGNFHFNHTIMAVALPGANGFGAVLEDGPAKGRLLFDPTWTLGFQDEVWWSRLARPELHA